MELQNIKSEANRDFSPVNKWIGNQREFIPKIQLHCFNCNSAVELKSNCNNCGESIMAKYSFKDRFKNMWIPNYINFHIWTGSFWNYYVVI